MVESYKQLRLNPSDTTFSSHRSYNNSTSLPVALKTPSHPASLWPAFSAVSLGSPREHAVVPQPCAKPALGPPGEAHVTMGLTIFSRRHGIGLSPTIGPAYEPSSQKAWTDSVFHIPLKPSPLFSTSPCWLDRSLGQYQPHYRIFPPLCYSCRSITIRRIRSAASRVPKFTLPDPTDHPFLDVPTSDITRQP
jgi:hypothetical protein